jgi:hypothetical protein
MLLRTSWFLALALGAAGCHASVSAGGQASAAASTDDEPADASTVQVTKTLPAVAGNDQDVAIGPGRYEGDLVVGGNHNTVHGAGRGVTIVTGRLQVSGNHNTVTGLTVLGETALSGNRNDVSGAELEGSVEASGNHNQR